MHKNFLTATIISFFIVAKRCLSYEYMDEWEELSETALPEKEGFYSHLNMEDITDADYADAKRVLK